MPQPKERMAVYARESNPSLADSVTLESQVKAAREYGEKQGYLYDPARHEYKEAISAHSVPYFQRPRVVALLKAATRHEFDVVVVTEVRALSRRGAAEVLLIYDSLLKAGVRLETITEKFADNPIGETVLTFKSNYARLEREQAVLRMARGRADRIAIGNAPPGHPKTAYGYTLIDTEKEVNGRYELNIEVIYIDAEGNEWTEGTVVKFIFIMIRQGNSINDVTRKLNLMGIPTPMGKSPEWRRASVYSIITNPIYIGEVWVNRYRGIKNKKGKTSMKLLPPEEWTFLPEVTAPPLITRQEWEDVKKQLQINHEKSMRNNKRNRENVGLLRCGHIFCGVCGRRMHVRYSRNKKSKEWKPTHYSCEQSVGIEEGITKHITGISLYQIERLAKEKIIAALKDSSWVRQVIASERERINRQQGVISPDDLAQTIAELETSISNLYVLAENARNKDAIMGIAARMNELDEQKETAEMLLKQVREVEEDYAAVEEEIARFETWVEKVRPQLTNPDYNPDYDEWRLAIRILGVRTTIYPSCGDWPYRYSIEVTVPDVMKKP